MKEVTITGSWKEVQKKISTISHKKDFQVVKFFTTGIDWPFFWRLKYTIVVKHDYLN